MKKLEGIREKIHKLSRELWCELDTLEEISTFHDDDKEYFNDNEMGLYSSLQKFLEAEGIFVGVSDK
ncbi:hypothetical protein [Bacillus sp. 3P20]|uniref:hypothetical protein n=1 Tax=Bacillus sp. 3P20 TaxID=3079309 RepID=UPI0039B4FEFD